MSQNGCSQRQGSDGVPTVVLRLADLSLDGMVTTQEQRYVPLLSTQREKYSLLQGDLLAFRVNGSKAIAGQVAYYQGSEGFTFCDHFIRFRLKTGLAEPKFIALAFKVPQIRSQVEQGMVSSAGQNTVSQSTYANVRIPFPPFNEQRRIVAKIEALKARSQRVKEELEAIAPLLDQFRQSVLAAAFRGDLTADWRRQDNEEFLGYDFPSTWNKKLLGDVVEGLKQGWSPKCENFPSPSDDIWGVIKTTAVQSLRFVEGENKQLPSHLEPRPELELVEGDLLITRAGPRARAGVTCLVSSVRPKLIVCDKVYRFRAKESYVLPLYLAYFLNSPSTISLIDELKTGISDSGVNLTQEKFLALPLWFPSIAEQQEIVSRIELFFKAAAQIEQQYQEAKAYLEQLDQSILGKAFRGELVPQDPNDEPASVVLERIRAEREKLDTNKKAKGKTEKKSRKAKPEPAEPEQLSLPGFE